ncbi:preprotein translocase subunit YidC [Candidatus Phytoplasma solani]|uniref:membrane protein insertase YidC n=1 Tax=Candidatus Phytoplasma solani TaxID=69896 RepID=UPI0032DB7AA5
MKNSIFKQNLFLFILLFVGVSWWFFWPSKPIKINELAQVQLDKNDEEQFIVYTLNNKHQEIKVDTKQSYEKWLDDKKKEKYFFGLFDKKQPVVNKTPTFSSIIHLPFSFKKANGLLQSLEGEILTKKKVEIIKNLLTVPAGTKIEYIENKKYKEEFQDSLEFDSTNLIVKFEEKDKAIEKLKKTSSEESLKLTLTFKLESTNSIPIFVTNYSLPIQWPKYLEWSFFGYFWNVLIISISSFLYIFSTFWSTGAGIFLGNLGLGIILTTIWIRTLTWPIYTKTSTFSMNMNLIQPEIEKVKQKYALHKDPTSAQKMQLEILKVYRKNNFSFWGFLVSFLQLPLFIAINQTLTRFIIPGGIFETNNLTEKLFLGFISLNPEKPNRIIVIILLSFLVGITMFILNKISFKKPDYLKTSTHNLTLEQKAKAKQSEKTMKITSWVMIVMMVLFSRSNPILSLYWIVGNTYTIFQTLITRKKTEQKYLLLKNKSI